MPSWTKVISVSSLKVIVHGILVFLLLYPLVAGAEQLSETGKAQQLKLGSGGSTVIISKEDSNLRKCVERCIRDNQMVAVGIEKIRADCTRGCEFKQALRLSQSSITKERIRGIKKLCEIGDKRALPVLISSLEREFRERTGLSAWIIPTLGKLSDPAAVPVLIKSLKLMDEYWLDREISARALGKIGDPSAIAALIEASDRLETREAAIEALATFDDVRVVPALLTALEPEEDENTRRVAMDALRRLGSKAVPDLIHAYKDFSHEYPQTQRRLWICQLLGEIGDERALGALLHSLDDPDKAVRKCAERGLFPVRDKALK